MRSVKKVHLHYRDIINENKEANTRRGYMQAYVNPLKQYQKPEKRSGSKKESGEQVAHKVVWAVVKKKYEKQGDTWMDRQSIC